MTSCSFNPHSAMQSFIEIMPGFSYSPGANMLGCGVSFGRLAAGYQVGRKELGGVLFCGASLRTVW